MISELSQSSSIFDNNFGVSAKLLCIGPDNPQLVAKEEEVSLFRFEIKTSPILKNVPQGRNKIASLDIDSKLLAGRSLDVDLHVN